MTSPRRLVILIAGCIAHWHDGERVVESLLLGADVEPRREPLDLGTRLLGGPPRRTPGHRTAARPLARGARFASKEQPRPGRRRLLVLVRGDSRPTTHRPAAPA